MAVFSGPEIVNSGLVFHYDIDNVQKSWKGEPTVNLIANSDPTTGWSVANYLTSAATVTFETENNIPHMKITNVVVDTGYPRIEPSSNLTSTVTDGFSASFEAKGTPGSAIKLALYSAGSTKISLTANLTSDWQRFTFNNQTTGFTLDKAYFRIDTNNTGDVRYVRRIQVEQKNYSTPYVKGTRTANQAIIDMIGGVVLQANSLTYNSNNTFSFNGTNSFVNVSSTINAKTVISTVNPTIISGDYVIYGPKTNGEDNWLGINGNQAYLYFTEIADINNQSIRSSVNLTAGSWNQIACTIDTNTVKLFVNGNESNSSTVAWTVGSWNGGVDVGKRGNVSQRYYSGMIGNILVYNRVLSAAEIRQNFEALRSRFNL